MTEHSTYADLDTYLPTVAPNTPGNFYNIIDSHNCCADRYPRDKYSLPFSHYAKNPRQHNFSNADLLARGREWQRHLPPQMIVVPCQWDEHANLGEQPAIGSNIIYTYKPHVGFAGISEANFLLAFHEKDMSMDKVRQTQAAIAETMHPELPVASMDLWRYTKTCEIAHPNGKPNPDMFDKVICLPMRHVMDNDFVPLMPKIGALVDKIINPPTLLQKMLRNVRSLVDRDDSATRTQTNNSQAKRQPGL